MDLMLDLETLGTKPGCVILSIGVVAFEPTGVALPDSANTGLVFYQNLTIFDQLMLGLTIEPETVNWWKTKSDDAKKSYATDQITLQGGLFRLITWLRNLPGSKDSAKRVWAKSPEFDCNILEHAGNLVGVNFPWTFRERCDVRTLIAIGDLCENGAIPATNGVLHNALDDCFHQARAVQHVINGVRKNGPAKVE